MRTKANYIEVLRFYPFIICSVLVYLLFKGVEAHLSLTLFLAMSAIVEFSSILTIAVLFEKNFCLWNKVCGIYDIIAAEYVLARIFIGICDLDRLFLLVGAMIASMLIIGTVYGIMDSIYWKSVDRRKRR